MYSTATGFLIAFALATDRILILPKIAYPRAFIYAFDAVNIDTLDRIIEWREDSFFQNPKTNEQFEGPIEITQASLGKDVIGVRHYHQFPIDMKYDTELWYEIPKIENKKKTNAIFHILNNLDYVERSTLLLLRIDLKDYLFNITEKDTDWNCWPQSVGPRKCSKTNRKKKLK